MEDVLEVEPATAMDVNSQSCESTDADGADQTIKRNENGTIVDADRLQICNIPTFFGFKHFKKYLEKNLPGTGIRKIRQLRDTAYVSFASPEEAENAIPIINGLVLKKSQLSARFAPSETRKLTPRSTTEIGDVEKLRIKTARATVTPLAEMPYEEQLKMKVQKSTNVIKNLINMGRKAGVADVNSWTASSLLAEIVPSPKITSYRNKNEFTIGLDLDGKPCVGFVGGKFSENRHFVMPLGDCEVMSTQTRNIALDFQEFVVESGLPTFDEFARVGTWKLLTVREFSGDVMLIVTIFPFAEQAAFDELKKKLVDRYMTLTTLTERKFRVTSLYISVMEHASDSPNYELIAGAPYVYESMHECRFRISPSAFFQTNSKAAAVLYSKIGEKCGLVTQETFDTKISEEKEGEGKEDDLNGASEAKRARLEGDEKMETADAGTVLLDICCGTGTIGQCITKEFKKKNKICCVGIELVESAVEDARNNAEDNGLKDTCKYIAGKAEDVFRSMRYNLQPGFSLEQSKVVGVLDPPRAGLQNSVIIGCRQMAAMKKLVYVSCDPSSASKNIVDLCRPRSNKFDGHPFTIESITPVDMFPMTPHVEWIVTLVRG